MININELRRLAQAATPHVGHACTYQDAHWLREGHVDFENADLFIASERPQEDAAFYAAANPAAISELLDRLEAAEKETASWKGLAKQFGNEADALRAKIEAMERQRPVRFVFKSDELDEQIKRATDSAWAETFEVPEGMVALYALPGAQPAPSVPDGWKLVPIVSTAEMDNAGSEHCDGYLSTAQVVWDAMLAAAPEAKP